MHVDATDLYESRDPRLASETARRQEIVFLALDLVSGKVDPGHTSLVVAAAIRGDRRRTRMAPGECDRSPAGRPQSVPDVHPKTPATRGPGAFAFASPTHPANWSHRLGQLYLRTLWCPAFHQRDGVARLSREAATLDGPFPGGGAAAARSRASRWWAIRGGRCSISSPGPTARVCGSRRNISPRWVCGTSIPVRQHVIELLTPLVGVFQGYAAGGIAAVGPLAGRPVSC